MSKLTRKCPNCGATVPADVKYCRKCHARMDSGRVEVLEKPAEEQPARPQKRDKNADALRNLPRPVRPADGGEPSAQNMEERPVRPPQNGYYPPEQADERGRRKPVQRERRAPAGEQVPRPMSTARGVNGPVRPDRDRDRNLWQIITVLAIILVIIVVAIVLVIRLNRPSGPAEASDPYESANVITSSTAAPSPTPVAANTPVPTVNPENLIVPDATPVPAPSATPVTITPVPAPSATPAANNNVTPVNDTIYINGNGVNIRSGPGTSYSVIGSESTGKQLQRTGRTNGWSQVSYNGQTGYVYDNYVTTTQPAASTNTASGTNSFNVTEASGTVKVAAASGANLRTGPGTNYSVAATVPVNTELSRTGTSGSWTRVSYNGQSLFISTSLLASDSSGTASGTGTATGSNGVTADSGTVTVTGNGVRIRSGPGTGYSQIGSVNSGNVLTVTGKAGDWYQVSYNGQTGYISATYARKN